MRLPILKVFAITALVVLLLGGVLASVAVAAMPAVRHALQGWWNDPKGLAALPDSPQVHYEPGAEDAARAVAQLLPVALARVESAQGLPFAHPVTIGVYRTAVAFGAANGIGLSGAVGTTFLGRVTLSPVLFTRQRQRLPAILTHELSHAHLQGWIGEAAYIRLPNWFKEGLAVTVSGGGGAEGVGEIEAREAIRRGDHIALETAGSPFRLGDIRFATAPEIPDSPHRVLMAYRQAGMFVAYLEDSDPAAFRRLLAAIVEKQPFAEALTKAYGADLPVLWERFVPGQTR